MQNYIGKQIDRYHITERLGMGGMAVVYKAFDTRLERDVALKLIRTEEIPPSQLDRVLERFQREAKNLAKLTDVPGIVTLLDYGVLDQKPYLVMGYLPGGTLKDQLGDPIDPQKALADLLPVARAIEIIHALDIIHRDIKPSNLLIDRFGKLALADFGIAKAFESQDTSLTGTGLGVGTPEYMAPEQWKGQTSKQSDVYGLGVVLYEMITGEKPYEADTASELFLKVMTEPLRNPRQFVPDIKDDVYQFLQDAMARDLPDRISTMAHMVADMEKLLSGTPEGAAAGEGFILGPEHPEGDDQETSMELEKATEPVKGHQAASKPELKQVVDSEGETRDALEPTPVEVEVRRKAENQPGSKEGSGKRLPSWLPWGLLGVLAVVLVLVLALSGGGGEEPEPVEVAAAQEESADEKFPTLTETLEPSPTHTVTLTPTESLGVGSILFNDMDGAEMVYVPAGEFLMGSEDGDSDEAPEHSVYLDAYWIYKYEVTNAQFAAFLKAQGNQSEGGVTWLDAGDEDVRITQSGGEWVPDSGYRDHPVAEVTWYGAQAYCEWAGGRLPTEAEWEKAARGDDGRKYPWGEESPSCSLAQYGSCSGETVPVGSYSNGTSPYGALDMAGNVWEWVGDWYDADYYASSPGSNPTGPGSGTYRVTRGGSWDDGGRYLRASLRGGGDPDFTDGRYGFRCFRSPEP